MIDYIQNLLITNQYVAPAVLAVLSGAISATVIYLCKEIPMKVWGFLKSQLVTTMTIQTGDWDQDRAYLVALNILEPHKINWLRRKWSLVTLWDRKLQCTQVNSTGGYGTDFYWFRGKLFITNKTPNPEMHGGDTGKRHEQLLITWFGRHSQPVNELVNMIGKHFVSHKVDPTEFTEISKFVKEITPVSATDKITLDDIAIEPETKDLLKMAIEDFIDPKNVITKKKLGIANKLVILMHGEPGTGKTLLCRAIAGELQRALILYSEDSSLLTLASEIHGDKFQTSVLAFEDFDTLGISETRQLSTPSTESKYLDLMTQGSLGTFLNILDGAIPLNGNVVIMTTNHLEKIDPAVYRDGRVTLLLPIVKLTASTVKTHLESLYGPLPELDGYWKPMLGASLHTIKNTALTSRNVIIDIIKSNHQNETISTLNTLNDETKQAACEANKRMFTTMKEMHQRVAEEKISV